MGPDCGETRGLQPGADEAELMSVTVQAHDLVIAALALLGVVMFAGAALALLVRVLGRKISAVEEAAATWLLRDAAGWRAREEAKARLREVRVTIESAAGEVSA